MNSNLEGTRHLRRQLTWLRRGGFCLLGMVAIQGATLALPQGGAAVVATIPVGDNPNRLDLDPTTNLLYVTNTLTNDVSVIDTTTNTVVNSIPVGTNPNGIEVNSVTSRVYVANHLSHTVSVIDTTTNSVLTTIPVGTRPNGIVANAVTNRIYVVNVFSDTVSVINGATNTVVASIVVGDLPVDVALDSTTNKIYISNFNDNTISVIDGATDTVTATIPAAGGPSGMIIDVASGRLFVAQQNADVVLAIDTSTNTVVGMASVGDLPSQVAYNPTLDRIYVTNQTSGDLHILDASTLAPIESLAVGNTPIGVFADPITNLVYIANILGDDVTVVSDGPADTTPPTAVAGADQVANAGDTVFLDGNSSFDDTTATANLLYSWSFTAVPAGSAALLTGATSAMPSFVADLPGSYLAELVVTDEAGLISAPDEVEISSLNMAPTADAGLDQTDIVNTPVLLDGLGSSDPELDPLTYSWTLISAPVGSGSVLVGANSATPTLTPDLEGDYCVELVVNDGFQNSLPDGVIITAVLANDFAKDKIREAFHFVRNLSISSFDAPGHKHVTLAFLRITCFKIMNGDLDGAAWFLTHKVIPHFDGCALRGQPDPKGRHMPHRPDWIIDCNDQQQLYDCLIEALDALST